MEEIRIEEARKSGPRGFVILRFEPRKTKRDKEVEKTIKRIKERSKRLGQI